MNQLEDRVRVVHHLSRRGCLRTFVICLNLCEHFGVDELQRSEGIRSMSEM